MPTPTTNGGGTKSTPSPARRISSVGRSVASNGHDPYVVPVVHITVPEAAINAGFWAALIGAATLGAIDLPLAALIGAGVLVARHHHAH